MRLFICGRERTGKTVLRNVLNTCSGVFIANESKMFDLVYKAEDIEDYISKITSNAQPLLPYRIHKVRNIDRYVNRADWPLIIKHTALSQFDIWGDKSQFYYYREGTPLQMYEDGVIDFVIYVRRNLDTVIAADRLRNSRETYWTEARKEKWKRKWEDSVDKWGKIKDQLPSLTIDFESFEQDPKGLAITLGTALGISIEELVEGIARTYESRRR